MPTNNDFDTSFAKTISQIMATELSTYSASPDTLLGNIDVLEFGYGKQHVTRPISDPYQDVQADRRFSAPEQEASKLMQDIDFVCLSKRLRIDRVDYAADPKNVANHIRDAMSIVKNGIEKYFIEGSSTRVTMYGLEDFPNATAGTLNRPEMSGQAARTATWSTTANLRADIITKMDELIADKFYGPFALLAPSIVRPMIAEVIANTSVGVSEWIKSTIGIPIIFSPFVHEGATKADFNCYLVDLSKIHFGMSDLKVDAFYSNEKHAYFVDYEIYMAFLSDPLWEETAEEYIKGIARLDGCSW